MPRKTNSALPFRRGINKFTDAKKQNFLDHLAKNGRIAEAAAVAGVSSSTIKQHKRSDKEFAEAVEEATKTYQEVLEAEIHRRGVEGVEEPVFDFKNGGQMGTVRKFSDKMLELHAKRHVKAYRPGGEDEEGSTGGVLVVTATPATTKEWEKNFRK